LATGSSLCPSRLRLTSRFELERFIIHKFKNLLL
jgi:hypothetical protein